MEDENLCRICLDAHSIGVDQLLINIFDVKQKGIDFSIEKALIEICGLENICENDLLPQQICSLCCLRLEEAFKLRTQALQSQSNFIDALNSQEYFSNPPPTETSEDLEIEYLEETHDSDELDEADEVSMQEIEILDGTTLVSLEKENFDCCGCQSSFGDEAGLLSHSRKIHRAQAQMRVPVGKVQCNVCYIMFSSEQQVVLHRNDRNAIKLMKKCDFCGCSFKSNDGLIKHLQTFHSDQAFKCCSCDSEFRAQRDLFRHVDQHHRLPVVSKTLKINLCVLCGMSFGTYNEKLFHERYPYRLYRNRSNKEIQTNETFDVFRCCGCRKVFSSIPELRSHQTEEHWPQRSLQTGDQYMKCECDGCFKVFKTTKALNQHLRKAASKKLYACSKCSITRKSLKDLMEHSATHIGDQAFLCCGCREPFGSLEALEQHSLDVHANKPKIYMKDADGTERQFECNICYRSYKTGKDLRLHQRLVYYEKVHVCDICGKGFSQEHALDLHLATHKTEPEFACPTCKKMYKHEALVRSCMVRHERPKEHRCKICQVTFPAASNLYSHMVSHSEDRRHKCDVCGHSFKRSFHLKKHQNIHTSQKNYPCQYCPARFCSTTELYKHEIRHTGIFPYQCEICNKKLTTRQVYIKHYEAHMEESLKIFRCSICPLKFSRDHFLSNHIKYKHKIEPQDKSWNEKFNRQAPARSKGGPRKAGTRGIYVSSLLSSDDIPSNVFQEEIIQ
ncbi:zinc finger protein 345-like isoform X2 [Uranotaenia lowii]|uniref:zinc finger protein 345-like isoform X2 n=1 Tax=Uranotaenia lowii TaxID=190385 RepID=UPI00247A6EBA|nr:zinc finger protein 345-like isoform X2 [Uranotaenia lowii]